MKNIGNIATIILSLLFMLGIVILSKNGDKRTLEVLDKNNKVVFTTKNISPRTFTKTFTIDKHTFNNKEMRYRIVYSEKYLQKLIIVVNLAALLFVLIMLSKIVFIVFENFETFQKLFNNKKKL
jgi:Na+/H+-dicarboxylate symporter